MNEKTKSKTTYWLRIVIIGVVLGVGLQFVRAWTEPPAGYTPPNGNVGGPLNTGVLEQTKGNGLILNGTLRGVYAQGSDYGVWGVETDTGVNAYLASNGWAGYFNGPINVRGDAHILNNTSLCESNATGCFTAFSDDARMIDNNDSNIQLKMIYGGNLQISNGGLYADKNVRGSDLVSGGSNSWMFHTPDDGRTTLYIAPGTNDGNWNWGKNVYIENSGKAFADDFCLKNGTCLSGVGSGGTKKCPAGCGGYLTGQTWCYTQSYASGDNGFASCWVPNVGSCGGSTSQTTTYFLNCDGSGGGAAPQFCGCHNPSDCTAAGGAIQNDGSMQFCKFSGSSCPSGWSQYANWRSTSSNGCGGDNYGCGYATSCSTGGHGFSNAGVESCDYRSDEMSSYQPWNATGYCVINSDFAYPHCVPPEQYWCSGDGACYDGNGSYVGSGWCGTDYYNNYNCGWYGDPVQQCSGNAHWDTCSANVYEVGCL